MSETYRVQEYVNDGGAFHKHSIYELYRHQYHNTNNDSLYRRLVILPPDDAYGERLPNHVRTWEDMAKLADKAESESRREERED